MTEYNEYAPGTFSWVDLGTTDAAGAKAFYTQLFGWQADDSPAGPDMVYTMLSKDGKGVAGLYQMGAEQQAQGMPPFWLSYVSVADVEASAAKAKSLGGQVLREPMDVMDAGRMALIQDPTGAMLALWQPIQHHGADLANEPGSLSWNELATRDTDKAGEFYTKLFGWDTQVQEMPQTTYTTFLNGDRMNGGMMPMTEEWGDIPPHWMVYFAVEDCDQSAEKAKELGGQVRVPPTDIPPVGRFAVIQDPQGGTFTIIKLSNPGQ
jgi:hypothetical protein